MKKKEKAKKEPTSEKDVAMDNFLDSLARALINQSRTMLASQGTKSSQHGG